MRMVVITDIQVQLGHQVATSIGSLFLSLTFHSLAYSPKPPKKFVELFQRIIGASPTVKIVYVVLEAQYLGRDEEQVHQPRAQSLGPCGVAPAENEPALVQVHIHGGDARQRRWRHTSVKASPLPFQNARDL
jgi:hypothetical protein